MHDRLRNVVHNVYSFLVFMYVCIEVALCADAHGIGRSNWAKGRDPSDSWVQYPNPIGTASLTLDRTSALMCTF